MSSDKMEIDEVESTDKLFENLNEDLSAIKSNKSNKTKKRKLSSAHTPPSPPITKDPEQEYLRKEDVIKSRKNKNKTKKQKKNNRKIKKAEEDDKMEVTSPYGSETGKKELIAVEFQKKVVTTFMSKRGTMMFVKKNVRKAYYDAYINNMNRIKSDRQYEINERRGLNTTTIVTAVLIGHGGDLIKDFFEDDSTLILSTAGVCGLPGVISIKIGEWYLKEFEKNIKKHVVINEFLNQAQKVLKPLYKDVVNDYFKENNDPEMSKYFPGLKFADYKELNCQFIAPLCDRYYKFENININLVHKSIEYSEFRIVDILKHHVKKDGSKTIERYIDYPTNLNELYSGYIGASLKRSINNNKYTSFKDDGNIKTINLGNIVEIFKNVYGINTNLNIIDTSCRVIADADDFSVKDGIIPNISNEELVARVNKEFEKGKVLASRKLGD